MAKSEGNFIMLKEAITGTSTLEMDGKQMLVGWTADCTRMALAAAGDGLDDANFSCETADKTILRLTTELEWIDEMLSEMAKPEGLVVTASTQLSFWDKAFEAQMDLGVINTQKAYEAMRYRDVAKYGFYDWIAVRDTYRDCCIKAGCPMNARLVRRFIEQGALIISPVLTFFTEHVWCNVLGHKGSIKHARWPEVSAPDVALVRSVAFIHDTVRSARLKVIDDAKKRLKKGDKSKATSITIGISNEFPEYHQRVLRFLANKLHGMAFPDDIMAQAQKFCTDDPVCKASLSKALKHVAVAVARIAEEQSPEALELQVPFDQSAILDAHRGFITKAIELDTFNVVLATGEADTAVPGIPQYSVP